MRSLLNVMVWRCWQKLQQMYKSCRMTQASKNQSTRLRVDYYKANTCPRHMWHLKPEITHSHGTGQVWKQVLVVSRQYNAWTRTCLWAYVYVKRQQICFEHIKANSVLSTAISSLIHCSPPTLYDINSSLHGIACTLRNFVHKLLMLH